MFEVGSLKLEVRSWKLEVGSRKFEVRSLELFLRLRKRNYFRFFFCFVISWDSRVEVERGREELEVGSCEFEVGSLKLEECS